MPRRYQNTHNTEKYTNDEYQNYETTTTNPVRSPERTHRKEDDDGTQDFKPFIKIFINRTN